MIFSPDENTHLSAHDLIHLDHWNEWKSSCVSENIIRLNVRTIYDGREIDAILNINTARRWKHSSTLVPCWYVAGLDPLTDEPTLQGVQVKPNTPPIGRDGKPLKYLGAKDFEAAPLFLDVGIPFYWKSIIDDVLAPVVITEGAKKAGAGLSLALPTISIPGVSTCRRKGRLHSQLELFAKLGRTFNLVFDNDILRKLPVQKALTGLAKELAAKGSKVMIVQLPEGEPKGMDDFIAAHGKDEFLKLINSALTFEEWRDLIESEKAEFEQHTYKSKVAQNFQIFTQHWGQYLRYNTLKKRVELNGNELNADDVRLVAALEFDVDISTSDAHSIIKNIARMNSYSPVVDYLNEVEAKYPTIEPTLLDNLAKEYFGTDDPMHSTFLKKFLVASVARARQPGCKVDTVLMLCSPAQGLYKSTFFKYLFGEDWFSDQLGDASDKDERMKMHRFWCLEWSEFEQVYKRKDVSTLKNFITSTEDTFRAPYDREPVTYPRSCVFVGTTNEQQILNDPTGDRRFWIIPVSRRIEVRKVLVDRDKIWACANLAYKQNYKWYLSDEEELRRAELNRDYHSLDPWSELLEPFLSNVNFVSTQFLFEKLDIEAGRRDTGLSRRLAGIMRRFGWESGREFGSRGKRGWVKTQVSEKFQDQDLSGSSGSTQENQVFGVDPDKKDYLDQSGSSGSTENDLIHMIQIDPDVKSDLDQSKPLPHKDDPNDPDKPPSKAKTFMDDLFIGTDLGKPIKFIPEGVYLHVPSKRKCKICALRFNTYEAIVFWEGQSSGNKDNVVLLSQLEAVPESPRFKEGDTVKLHKNSKKTYIVSSFHQGEIWLKESTRNSFAKRSGPYKSFDLLVV